MKISKWWWIATSSVVAMLLFCPQAFAQAESKLIPFWDDRENSSQLVLDHSPWQSILDVYLDDQHPSGISRFSYSAVTRADIAKLRSYLEYLQVLEPRQLNDLEQKAFWINLYNASTVYLILDDGADIPSIRSLRSGVFTPGPWRRKFLKVVQQSLSLEDIQHGILRPIWNDPRIHYALYYASIGSPNLQKTVFTAQNIESLLDSAAREFINHPRAASVSAGKKLELSKIYDWYRDDFGANSDQVMEHIRSYAQAELVRRLEGVEKPEYEYDWALNSPE